MIFKRLLSLSFKSLLGLEIEGNLSREVNPDCCPGEVTEMILDLGVDWGLRTEGAWNRRQHGVIMLLNLRNGTIHCCGEDIRAAGGEGWHLSFRVWILWTDLFYEIQVRHTVLAKDLLRSHSPWLGNTKMKSCVEEEAFKMTLKPKEGVENRQLSQKAGSGAPHFCSLLSAWRISQRPDWEPHHSAFVQLVKGNTM